MGTALDDRTFESAVDLTPEQQEANLKHFRDKGYDVEIESGNGEDVKPPEPPADGSQPSPVPEPTPKPEPQPAEPRPAEGPTPTPGVADGEEIDAETQHEWNTAKNDGEKLGRAARKTKKIRELEGIVAQKDGTIAELRRQAERQPSQPAAPSSPLEPKPAEPKPAEAAQPPQPKQFEKPKPPKPKFEDFQSEPDPYVAYTAAVDERNEKLVDWQDEKRAFEDGQKAEVQRQTQQQEQARSQDTTRQTAVQKRFEEARTEFPDFDARVNATQYNPVLTHLLGERLPDGPKLGYLLSLPENAATLKTLREASQTFSGEAQDSIARKLDTALMDLAIFKHSLRTAADLRADAPAPPAPKPPVAAAPAPIPTPPAPTPRREEAAPTPVRGQGAPAMRPEDIDPMDSDARRALRKAQGQMR